MFSFNETSPGLLVAVHRPESINDKITFVSLEEKRIVKSFDTSGRIYSLVNIIDGSNKAEIKNFTKEYHLWPHIIGAVINNVFIIGHFHAGIQEEFFEERQNLFTFNDTCAAESLREVIYVPHCYTIVLALQNELILRNLKTGQKQPKCFDGNIEAIEYQKSDEIVFLWAVVSKNNQLVGHLGLLSKSGKETVEKFQFTHQLNFPTDFKKFISLKTFGGHANVFVESDFACFMFFNQNNETCELKSDAMSHSASIKLLCNDFLRNLYVESDILTYLKLVQDNLFNYLLCPEAVCKKLVEYEMIPKYFRLYPSVEPILSSLCCNNLIDSIEKFNNLFDGIKKFVPCASIDQLNILLEWIKNETNMNPRNPTKLRIIMELICRQKRKKVLETKKCYFQKIPKKIKFFEMVQIQAIPKRYGSKTIPHIKTTSIERTLKEKYLDLKAQNRRDKCKRIKNQKLSRKLLAAKEKENIALKKEIEILKNSEIEPKEKIRRLNEEQAQKFQNKINASEHISVTKDGCQKRCRSAPGNSLNISDKRLKLDDQRPVAPASNSSPHLTHALNASSSVLTVRNASDMDVQALIEMCRPIRRKISGCVRRSFNISVPDNAYNIDPNLLDETFRATYIYVTRR
uniref:Uncharacterized protein n=1 Tax=Panagrolaimus sp. PS1159 TaxID=55785 RepID=A0AC35F200_9BILA